MFYWKNKNFLLCAFSLFTTLTLAVENRNFQVDWNGNRFLKDGQPFRLVSGSFDYFRAQPLSWQRKLHTMRAAGLNAVSTHVDWSLHNPKANMFNWKGIANLEEFIRVAAKENLYVILRVGPYICAERDLGGLPYWLLTKYPKIKLRTSDKDYLAEIRQWWLQLMPRIMPHLYGNGGPIILLQLENEYGSYAACDHAYLTWLQNETMHYVGRNAVLFTADSPYNLKCGHISGTLAAVNIFPFEFEKKWHMLREFQSNGPILNGEVYVGWFTNWGQQLSHVRSSTIQSLINSMLSKGANINFHMFYGGTNFGFTAGASIDSMTDYMPVTTSFDYNAPLNEAGDPTAKYYILQEIIQSYMSAKNISISKRLPKMHYGTVKLYHCCSLLSKSVRTHLAATVTNSLVPLTFEAINQMSGLVLYETDITVPPNDSTILHIPKPHDFAYVYVDEQLIGTMSREKNECSLNITEGRKLKVLVENQGRVNFNRIHDFKGIIGDVRLGNERLLNWTMTGFPFEAYEKFEPIFNECIGKIYKRRKTEEEQFLFGLGPRFYYGIFDIATGQIGDTFLNTLGWGKGVIFVNGINLGRYWPIRGPQMTLYVPNEILIEGSNTILLIEYQQEPNYTEIQLLAQHIFK